MIPNHWPDKPKSSAYRLSWQSDILSTDAHLVIAVMHVAFEEWWKSPSPSPSRSRLVRIAVAVYVLVRV